MDYKIKDDNGVIRVEFLNEHWYDIPLFDGHKWMPSVTMVINEGFPKGTQFEQWLRDTGNESKVIMREAGESGSLLHNKIEELLMGKSVSISDYHYTRHEWDKLVNFKNWFDHFKIEPIAIEKIVWSDNLGVAGTVDFVGKLNGVVTMFDWKTGNNIYESSSVQVAAYINMWNQMRSYGYHDMPEVIQGAVVHIGAKNKTFKDYNGKGVQVVMVDDLNDYDTFLACHKIYKRRNPDHKPPHHEYPATITIGGETCEG
jgi:hypothetical protein